LSTLRLFRIRAIGSTLPMFLLVGIVQSGKRARAQPALQLVEGYSTLATALG